MKKLRFFAVMITAAVCLCLSGCIPHIELDKQAIVEAMGIDKSGEGYEVSVQYFAMEGAGGTTLVDNTKANVLIAEGKGNTVYSALQSASAKSGKSFMFGIMNIIVIGESAADSDLGTLLSFAETYYENNPRLLLACAEGKASDIMNVKFKEQNVSANHLQALLINAENMGICECKRLYAVLEELRRPTGCTALPLLRAAETGTGATDDGKTVELSGGVLFSEGRPAARLPLAALSGIQLLNGKMRETCVPANIDGKEAAVTVYNIKRKITPVIENGRLRFEIEITAGGRYADSQLDDEQAIAKSGEAEKCVAEYIIRRIESAVRYAINGEGCDPCGLKYRISSKSYADWLAVSDNYGELLKTAEFPIRCDVSMDRFGLTN